MTVADAGLQVFLIAVVSRSGELELLRSISRVGRFREDDNIADGRGGLRPVVQAVHEDGVKGPGMEVVDIDHVGHLCHRHRMGALVLGWFIRCFRSAD